MVTAARAAVATGRGAVKVARLVTLRTLYRTLQVAARAEALRLYAAGSAPRPRLGEPGTPVPTRAPGLATDPPQTNRLSTEPGSAARWGSRRAEARLPTRVRPRRVPVPPAARRARGLVVLGKRGTAHTGCNPCGLVVTLVEARFPSREQVPLPVPKEGRGQRGLSRTRLDRKRCRQRPSPPLCPGASNPTGEHKGFQDSRKTEPSES
jgi:hypothetical protein